MLEERIIESVNNLPIENIIKDAVPEICFNSNGFAQSPFRPNETMGFGTSFSIHTARNMFTDWKLKGSGYTGGPVKFYQLYFNLGFVDSVVTLAAKYGIMSEEEAKSKIGKSVKKITTITPQIPNVEYLLAKKQNESDISQVYDKIIELSPLSQEHIDYLVARGLTLEEIEENRFFTMPRKTIARKLLNLGFSNLIGVPGFYSHLENDVVSFTGGSGIGIPCKNIRNNTIGLQIRNSDENSPLRYFWLSSVKADGVSKNKAGVVVGRYGCGPGTPIDYHKGGEKLLITEGKFKSIFVAREKDTNWDYSVASVQGVGNWAGIEDIIPFHDEFVIGYDSDLVTNDDVIKQVSKLAEYIKSIKPSATVSVMYWLGKYGKGIDDVLCAGNKEKVSIVSYEEWCQLFTDAVKTSSISGVSFEEAFNCNFK